MLTIAERLWRDGTGVDQRVWLLGNGAACDLACNRRAGVTPLRGVTQRSHQHRRVVGVTKRRPYGAAVTWRGKGQERSSPNR